MELIKRKYFFCCKIKLLLTTFLIIPFSFLFSDMIDLEELSQDFVLETKRIEIPGYPRAFNGSIVRWQGSLLLSFRVLIDPFDLTVSQIGLVWLNENFTPCSMPQLLDLRYNNPDVPTRTEDGRLFCVGERLYVIYNDNVEATVEDIPRQMYIAELHYDNSQFIALDITKISPYEGKKKMRSEKNWVPFAYNDMPYIAYSIFPHKILAPLNEEKKYSLFASTTSFSKWQKNWGNFKGGTPALLDGDEYLAFFHSWKIMNTVQSNNRPIYHYYVGAYTFASTPPFNITRMSPQPISEKSFYSDRSIYKLIGKHVIFPAGFIIQDQLIWLTYGRQDEQIWVAKIDKKRLLKSLNPVFSSK